MARVTLVNPVRTLFAPFDWFPRWTSRTIEAYYNEVVLARGWGAIATSLYYGVSLLNLMTYRRQLVDGLRRLYAEQQPDLVISLLPGINQLFVASVRGEAHRPKLLFLNTDLQETFRYSWFPPGGDYHVIAGTERSYRQALRTVCQPERVFRTSGMPVRRSFYAPAVTSVAKERARHGLDPTRFTLCLIYGGAGSQRMHRIARWLEALERPPQVIFLCGRNEALRQELESLPLRYPRIVVPYTAEVPYWFDLSDVLIGKSGPGFLSEALVRRRPLLIDRGSVMPQERYNLEWIVEQGVGLTFASRRQLLRGVATLGDPARRAELSRRAALLDNRAIFEIPEILRGLLETDPSLPAGGFPV